TPNPSIMSSDPKVLPIPFSMEAITSRAGIPSARPTANEVISNEKKALSLKTMTNNSNNRILPRTTTIGIINCGLLNALKFVLYFFIQSFKPSEVLHVCPVMGRNRHISLFGCAILKMFERIEMPQGFQHGDIGSSGTSFHVMVYQHLPIKHVGQHLHPKWRPRKAAAGVDDTDRTGNFLKHLSDAIQSIHHALIHRPGKMSLFVVHLNSEKQPLGFRIPVGSPFACQVRQKDQSLRTRRYRFGLPGHCIIPFGSAFFPSAECIFEPLKRNSSVIYGTSQHKPVPGEDVTERSPPAVS